MDNGRTNQICMFFFALYREMCCDEHKKKQQKRNLRDKRLVMMAMAEVQKLQTILCASKCT